MKIMTAKISLLVLLSSLNFGAQIPENSFFVTAESGLIVRKAPNRNGERFDKFPFATEVMIIEETGIALRITDNGKVIDGEWVKVSGKNVKGTYIQGYVFNGYLVDHYSKLPFRVDFQDFKLRFYNTHIFERNEIVVKTDTLKYEMDMENELFGVPFQVRQSGYDTVKVYQKFENAMAVHWEGPHCDMVDWKTFKTPWMEINYEQTAAENKTLGWDAADRFEAPQFTKQELDQAIQEHCTSDWYDLVKNIPNVSQYPASIFPYRALFKIVLSNAEKTVTKYVDVEIPMGC